MDGTRSDKYNQRYDDPYLVLAYHLVCHNTPETVRRFLTDYKFVERAVLREAKELDLSGPFLDCLVATIREEKQRADLLNQLEHLGKFFYRRLELSRLRAAIWEVCKKLEIDDLIRKKL